MATGTANSSSPRSTAQAVGGASGSEAERFIQSQLDQTRRRVKLMDLAVAVMGLLAGILGFLMLAAVVDHWIIELGFWARLAAMIVLTGASGWYFVRQVLPLLIYRINPVYAAQAIERGTPTLKNSLINFLMFRGQPSTVHRAVYQEMEHRAATDLQAVDIDAPLDRSRLLKVAYIFIAVLALCAVYRIASPENPFQSFSRVIIPWADIARPSRLEIIDVQPGEDTEIYFGRNVEVSAGLRVHSGERAPMQLIYSSADRQIERQALEMEWSESENRYRIELPGTAAGIQQDLTYELVAGDAHKGPYRLNTMAAPTILVQRVEYDPPAYTRQPDRSSQEADITGLEGTRVTVHARANQPIQAAYIQFDPDDSERSAARSELIEMSTDGDKAWGSFVLKFAEGGKQPLHSSYQVWFLAEDKSRRSENALTHRISVSRDLPPVVDILSPRRSQVELPLDSRLAIEVRAVDPDFGLRQIRLRAVSGGTEVLDEQREYDDRLGQVIEAFSFVPRKLNLSAGDLVTYRAMAEDNRQDTEKQVDNPNIEQTGEFRILITPPRETNNSPEDSSNPDSKPMEPESQEPSGDDSSKDGNPMTDAAGDNSEGAEGGENSQDADSNPDAGEESGEMGKQSGSGSQEQEGGSAGEPSADGQSSGSGQTSDSDPNAGGEAGSQQGAAGSGNDAAAQDDSSQTDPMGGQPGAGRGSDQQPGNSSEARSGDPNSPAGTPSDGPPPTEGDGPTRDLREDPLHDGEVIERVKKYLEQQKQQQQNADESPGQNRAEESDAQRDANSPRDTSASPPSSPDGNAGDMSPSGTSPGKRPDQNQPSGNAGPKDRQPDQQRGQGEKTPGSDSGEGGDPQGPMDRKDPNTEQDQADRPESKPGQGDNGSSGAGSPANSDQGAAESQGDNRDRQKNMKPGEDDKPEQTQPQSPTTSKRQSDSQGDQSGDRSGGGQQGPGQSAQRKGNDSAGSQSDADQGAGASDSSGQGETAGRAGDQQKADEATGSAGSETGEGSTTRDRPDQLPAQSDPADNDPNAQENPAGSSPTSRQPQRRSQGEKPAGQQGQVTGGGVAGDAENSDNVRRQPAPMNEPPGGDAPNLEYAREATDLVLEYLEDQERQPDNGLLDELGWTEEDMRKFVERWKSLKQNAEQQGDESELRDALRSLGLKPGRDSLRRAGAVDDQTRGLRQSGNRVAPPPAFMEQFNAARRGVAKGE